MMILSKLKGTCETLVGSAELTRQGICFKVSENFFRGKWLHRVCARRLRRPPWTPLPASTLAPGLADVAAPRSCRRAREDRAHAFCRLRGGLPSEGDSHARGFFAKSSWARACLCLTSWRRARRARRLSVGGGLWQWGDGLQSVPALAVQLAFLPASPGRSSERLVRGDSASWACPEGYSGAGRGRWEHRGGMRMRARVRTGCVCRLCTGVCTGCVQGCVQGVHMVRTACVEGVCIVLCIMYCARKADTLSLDLRHRPACRCCGQEAG